MGSLSLRRMFCFMLSVLIALYCLPVKPAGAEAAPVYDVSVSGVDQQTVKGWGIFPSWNRADWNRNFTDKTGAQQALFEDLGATMFRVMIPAVTGDGDGNLIEGKMQEIYEIINAGETRGMHDYMISVWSPPVGMKTLPTVNGWTGSEHVRLRTDKEAAYADYLVKSIQWLAAHGASVPKVLSFQNEPLSQIVSEWCYWGGDNGAQYRRVAKLLRSKLDEAGLTGVQILGPEGAAYHENELLLGEDFSALRADPALNAAIGGLASHSYFAKGFDNNEVYTNYRAALDQVPDKDLWQTEYSTLIAGVSEMDMAINAAQRLAGDMALIKDNYWFWWLGWANGRHPTDVGEVLLDGDGYTVTKSKAFYVLGKLFNNVPVGSTVRRVSADPASGLTTTDAVWMDAVAFVNGSQTTALLVNPTNAAKTVNVNGLTGSTANVYQLTGDVVKGQDMQLAASRNIQGGKASAVVLPARSVSVIVTSDVDAAPPHIVFDHSGSTSVKDAAYAVRDSQFTVSGHLDEAGTLLINGQAVPVAGDNSFSTTVVLQPGDNTITAAAKDGAGNEGEPATLFVRYDPAYLGLTLDQSGLQYVKEGEYAVSGRTNGSAAVTVKQTAGGETVKQETIQVGTPDEGGGQAGDVIRQILNDNYVSSGAGLTGAQGGFTTNAQVVWDSRSVFAPAEGERSLRLKLTAGFARAGFNFLNAANQAAAEDYAAVKDTAALQFQAYTKSKVDSFSAVLISDNGGTAVEARLPLSSYIAAADYGAKWTQVTIPLSDFDAAPRFNAATGEASSLPVQWSSVKAVGFESNHTAYYDPYIDDLKIVSTGSPDGGSDGGEDGGGSVSLDFSTVLHLNQGENAIAVTASNLLNQTAVPASVRVVYDPNPPVLTVPSEGSTSGTSYVLNGSVNEDAAIDVGGTPAALKPDRTFTAVVRVTKGENAITVTAKDPAGNESQASVIVTADPVEDGSLAPGVAVSDRAAAEPTIDGELSEPGWAVNNRVEKMITGASDNNVTFGSMWNDDKLFVAMKVLDANLVNDTAGALTYQDDSIELYLDGDNARGSVFGTDDHQITLGWHDEQLSVGGDIAGITFAQKDIDGGFTVEMAIPWSGIGIQPPANNAVIGFDAAYNDDDGGNGGLRQSQLMWRGNADNWRSTAAFGSLYLNDGKHAAAAVEPSGALTVDGALNEPSWSLNNSVAKAITGTSNNGVSFGTLGDTQNLYVGIEVLDADLRNDTAGAQTYQDDSVEVYLDADHNQGAAYDAFDHQLTLGWHDTQLSMIGNLANVQYAQKDISGGYTVELAIPWASLNIDPARDITLGFDVGNNDDDGGNAGNRESQVLWNGTGDNWRDTSGFGNLLNHNLSLALPDENTPDPDGLALFSDNNADLSKLYAKSALIVNASGHPENFANDATRIAHNIDNPTAPEYVAYRSPEGDIYSFDITTGLFSGTPQFAFYGSSDGVNFTTITAASKLTGGANGYAVFSNAASGLPAGTKYLKIEFPGLENWKEQLMNVDFKYYGATTPPDEGEVATFTDEAADLSKLIGKSGHIVNAFGGQLEKYAGDGDRIIHSNDDSLEPEYVIYKSPNGDVRSFDINATNWTSLPKTVQFTVYGSTDGQSFSELPVHSQILSNASGYDTIGLTGEGLPSGIRYLKIVFPYGDPACDNWTSTINKVAFTYAADSAPAEGPISAAAVLTGAPSVTAGQTYVLNYGVSDLQGSIAAEDLKLQYNPAMFDFVSASESKNGFSIAGQSAVPGTVHVILAAAGTANAVSEDGDILQFTFKAKTPDAAVSSAFSVTNNIVSTAGGEETRLEDAAHSVRIVIVDKSALSEAIAQAQAALNAAVEGTHAGQHRTGSKAILQAAVAAAQASANDAAVTQAQADQAILTLQAAVQAFAQSVIQTGDLNADGKFSAGDLGIAAGYYGKTLTDAGWDDTYRDADMNGDGIIDTADFAALAAYFQ
ncbi:sugar-binding protein [Paenibacillus sacheonensis]|uniref:Dockerin domain-containing protein n=1 Tax=Paenibacillus sacheonensis TaxID=742054 RepID=A0A7X4YSZ7_9BACL|nr:sugar-binding protein [Paenibacillus sacheonensis]MBM7563660.1 O-glycosyl hydrolase [Paenibacillus sacheonensis]NBC71046.1 hypothetical protein [Paenibacillus sacheonensis]